MTTLNIDAQLTDTLNGIFKSLNLELASLGDAVQLIVEEIGITEEIKTFSTEITGGNGPGWCLIINNGPTNFLEAGFATTVYPLRLNAGEFALFRLNTGETDLALKASTAAVSVLIAIWEGEAP